MKKTGTVKNTKRRETKPRALSNVVRPGNMSLKEWQVLLRRKAAEKDNLSVLRSASEYGGYEVRNFQTRKVYHVSYYRDGCSLNRCDCMDFRTSGLSTCKHMEAVKASKSFRRAPLPTGSRLFVDYSERPKIRIYYGTDDEAVIRPLAEPLFCGGEVLALDDISFLKLKDFVAEAEKASPDFLCSEDARLMMDRKADDLFRRDCLDRIFADKEWDSHIFVKGINAFPYQREGMEFACRAGRCVIADEMGLGKTLQAIGAAALLYREGFVDSVLVLCPTSLKYQWQKEIKKFIGKDATVIEGYQTARIRQYAGDGLFKIVSYNTVANDLKLLKTLKTDLLIMDEVQRLKNWNTLIAQAARRIDADYKIILSGTPLENKLEELYSVVQLVDQYVLGPYYKFRDDHIVTDATGKVLQYKGLNEIGDSLSAILLRRRKKDVALQLPARMDKNLFVPMTEEQAGMHSEFSAGVSRLVTKWKRMHFLSDTDRRRLMLLLSQMRMVCDSTYILDQQSRHDTKVAETMNIIDNICGAGDDKIVIFSQWERMTRLIAQELDSRHIGYAYLYGGVPAVKRKELMDRFLEAPEVRVFISTDAGATGLNLQMASYLINLDLPWNPAVLEQRIGRIYRIGQRRNVQVINLIAVNTIEEQMLSKLKFKSSMSSGVLDDGDDVVNMENNRLRDIVETFEFENYTPPVCDEAEVVRVADAGAKCEEECPENEEGSTGSQGDPIDSLIADGVSFVGRAVEVLGNEEAAAKLADRLVKTDSKTGAMMVNIPVKDKETVVKALLLLRNLFHS